MPTMEQRLSLGDDAQIFTMRELNQHTAHVIDQINASGRSALITRHGQFIAMITPLQGAKVSSLVLPAVAARYVGETSDEGTLTSEEILAGLEHKD